MESECALAQQRQRQRRNDDDDDDDDDVTSFAVCRSPPISVCVVAFFDVRSFVRSIDRSFFSVVHVVACCVSVLLVLVCCDDGWKPLSLECGRAWMKGGMNEGDVFEKE